MTRVSKGSRTKSGQPYLVCTRAKVGAGCEYHAARYTLAEAAFLANVSHLAESLPAGTGDAEADDEIERVESSISGTQEALEELLDTLQSRRSAAVAARIRRLEEDLDRLKARRAELRARQEASAGPLISRRMNDLKEAAETLQAALDSGGEPDRVRVNAVLRQVAKRVVVDFRDGEMRIEWRHGGMSAITYDMPD